MNDGSATLTFIMLIYAIQVGPRLQYILEFIGNKLFRDGIRITTDRNAFHAYNAPKINYSGERISENEFWMLSTGLLFEKGVKSQAITCFEINEFKAFFRVEGGDYPFDIFAASFYLLSRYEEYLPHEKDIYGRYAHADSVAHKENFLHLPLVNIWLEDVKLALSVRYNNLEFTKELFGFLPTYDIDIAWSYHNKGWWRNAGGLLRSLFQRDWFAIRDRIQVILKTKKDPFDSYAWLHQVHNVLHLKANYFFLLAFKQKGFDKNISPFNSELLSLIRDHDSLDVAGIHPSWQSSRHFYILQREIRQLARIVGHRIIHSRHHYLRFSLPLTYQRLISAGIQHDYSMGYGTINGFRASVASPFYWYDLEMEATTNLLIHPFCFMDANAYYQLKLSPEGALQQLLSFHKIIKEVNGLMITIWHNNFLGSDPAFAGWRAIYESFLRKVAMPDSAPSA